MTRQGTPTLLDALDGTSPGWEAKKLRLHRGAARFAAVVWGAMALWLAWTVFADARDLVSGAEARLVRVAPAELSPSAPPLTVSWTERPDSFIRPRFRSRRGELRSAPLRLRRGECIVVADAKPGDNAPFLGRVVDDDRGREISARIGRPCKFVVRTAGSAAWHFGQFLLAFPLFFLAYLLTRFAMWHWIDMILANRGLTRRPESL